MRVCGNEGYLLDVLNEKFKDKGKVEYYEEEAFKVFGFIIKIPKIIYTTNTDKWTTFDRYFSINDIKNMLLEVEGCKTKFLYKIKLIGSKDMIKYDVCSIFVDF